MFTATTTRAIRFFAADGTTRVERCDAGTTVDASKSHIKGMYVISVPGTVFTTTVAADAITF